jgi:hypothetical protein
LRLKDERIIFSNGEKIIPSEWDKKIERSINLKKFLQNPELNVWLDIIESGIKSVLRAFNLDNFSAIPEVIKDRINERLIKKKPFQVYRLLT